MTNIKFTSNSSNKDLRNAWIRKASGLMNLINKREKDLTRLKNTQAKSTIIQQVNSEIDVMVDFYNTTEETVDSFYLESTILKTEIILLRMQVNELSDWILELTKNNLDQREKFLDIISK